MLSWQLLLATLVGLASVISAVIKKLVAKLSLVRPSLAEQRTCQELYSLRRSLQSVSMADQFAQWAKLQRKINAATQIYQGEVSARGSRSALVSSVAYLVVDTATLLLSGWFLWCLRSVPVATMPTHLTQPIAALLAMPGCAMGEVSGLVWILLVRSSASLLWPGVDALSSRKALLNLLASSVKA